MRFEANRRHHITRNRPLNVLTLRYMKQRGGIHAWSGAVPLPRAREERPLVGGASSFRGFKDSGAIRLRSLER